MSESSKTKSRTTDQVSTESIKQASHTGKKSEVGQAEGTQGDREVITSLSIPKPLSDRAEEYSVYPSLLPVSTRTDPIGIGSKIVETVANLDNEQRSFTLDDCGISQDDPEVVDTILRLHQIPVCMGADSGEEVETELYTTDSPQIDAEELFERQFWNPDYVDYPEEITPVKDTEERLAFIERYGTYGTGSCDFFSAHFGIKPQSVTAFVDYHTKASSISAYLRADRETLVRTVCTLEQQTNYETKNLAPALNINPSTLRDWRLKYVNDSDLRVPEDWTPAIDWAEPDPSPILDFADHNQRKVSIGEWADYHRVQAKLLPLYSRLYDPLTTGLHIADVLADQEARQQSFSLPSVDLEDYNNKITKTLLRIHGVVVYERGGTRPKRYRNPNYQHYDTVLKPITDTDRRLRIYNEHTELGCQPVSWFCDHFGLPESDLTQWAMNHDLTPPREAVQQGREKLGRTLYTAIQWSPWDIESVARALGQREENIKQWILDGINSRHPDRGEWAVPTRPVEEEWFSSAPAYDRYNRDPVRFWEFDSLRDRSCKKS